MPETNGLKTAVKNGDLTPREALDKLMESDKETDYPPSKKLIGWLKRKDDATSG